MGCTINNRLFFAHILLQAVQLGEWFVEAQILPSFNDIETNLLIYGRAFLQQAWFWAGKARLSLLRTLPWALFSIAYIMSVGIMAIFSSEISKSPGPQRLLIGNCGLWVADDTADGLNAYSSRTTNAT